MSKGFGSLANSARMRYGAADYARMGPSRLWLDRVEYALTNRPDLVIIQEGSGLPHASRLTLIERLREWRAYLEGDEQAQAAADALCHLLEDDGRDVHVVAGPLLRYLDEVCPVPTPGRPVAARRYQRARRGGGGAR